MFTLCRWPQCDRSGITLTRALLTIILVSCASLNASQKAGLIVSGLDTIRMSQTQRGFDFVTQQSCTTTFYEPPYNCSNHFLFDYTEIEGYLLIVYNVGGPGYGLRMGKMNLDSIAFAPSDSVFQADGYTVHVDSIPPERLQEYVGDVYVLKSGRDPRPAWNQFFYFKIKILALNVVDSVNHHVDFVFLWACQLAGSSDIRTAGLDTFDIVPVSGGSRAVTHAAPRAGPLSAVVPLRGTFTLPPAWRGSVRQVGVYDMKGSLLGKVRVEIGAGVVDLSTIRGGGSGGGMVVVRGE